ncbi:unnamed protein product [Staurois parvus]|uniref:Uncharacterized protein n=1 Tax=Staurois parvus TaxID=386267 RepID=A0ABN9C146_9NEOB|nr:unnamed protein product [Staurois parvus]
MVGMDLKQSLGQVTTSGRAHQRLGRPPGMHVRYRESQIMRRMTAPQQGGTDSGSVGGKREPNQRARSSQVTCRVSQVNQSVE